jgi:lipoprotein-anchoring transpeptidase ErfK/SrfK
MKVLKIVMFVGLFFSFLFAKVDFVNFSDICKNESFSCKNNTLEIKAVQYLLKKRLNPNIKVTGVLDSTTIDTIKKLQIKENIPASGYIGKNTKDALNKLLYGHRLHKNLVKVNIKGLKDTKFASKIKKVDKKMSFKSYSEFKKFVDLKKSYAVYKDEKLLKLAGVKDTLLKVDISEQRVKLLVKGKVALDAPCTTGSKHKLEPNTKTFRDKRTPLGTFKIMEKVATKRSTIFGDIYKNGKLIYHGDRRKYKGSWRGVKFVGAPLKNWMRITSNGIGLHASEHVKRYPGSNGCIRLQPFVAKTLFKKIKPGTIVKVVN